MIRDFVVKYDDVLQWKAIYEQMWKLGEGMGVWELRTRLSMILP